MPLTKKEKLETFDAVLAERDLLRLAIFDLTCKATKFPFGPSVSIDIKEIDQNYAGTYKISKSDRAMPYYMVLSGAGAQFWTVRDIQDHAQDSDVYWRAVRYGAWKLANSTKSAWNASENA